MSILPTIARLHPDSVNGPTQNAVFLFPTIGYVDYAATTNRCSVDGSALSLWVYHHHTGTNLMLKAVNPRWLIKETHAFNRHCGGFPDPTHHCKALLENIPSYFAYLSTFPKMHPTYFEIVRQLHLAFSVNRDPLKIMYFSNLSTKFDKIVNISPTSLPSLAIVPNTLTYTTTPQPIPITPAPYSISSSYPTSVLHPSKTHHYPSIKPKTTASKMPIMAPTIEIHDFI